MQKKVNHRNLRVESVTEKRKRERGWGEASLVPNEEISATEEFHDFVESY